MYRFFESENAKFDASMRNWGFALQLSGENRDELDVCGVDEANSGGNWATIAPSITWQAKRWGVFLSYGIPIINEPNGFQDDRDDRISFGVRRSLGR
jgi:hypothetical protein